MRTVLAALLVEGHVVVVSSDVAKLALAVQALASLLEPLRWQHILVALLPRAWLDYVSAPMPFLVGVHTSMLDDVLSQPLEDSVLFADLDAGTVGQSGEPPLCGDGVLPPLAAGRLEKSWERLLADRQRELGLSPEDFSREVRVAAADFFVEALGDYRRFIDASAEDCELCVEEMVAAAAEDGRGPLLEALRETQMLEVWRREREHLARQGFPLSAGDWEARVAAMEAEIGFGAGESGLPRLATDVTTARQLVEASRMLRCEGEDGESAAAAIRGSRIWRRDGLWAEMLEDSIEAAGLPPPSVHGAAPGGNPGGNWDTTKAGRKSSASPTRSAGLPVRRDGESSRRLVECRIEFTECMIESR